MAEAEETTTKEADNGTGAGEGNSGNMWALGQNPSRVAALVDGVFAIAMTILVLEIAVPDLGSVGSPEEQTSLFLDVISHEFIPYAMGFAVLGVYWVLHHYMFHFIRRSTGVLVWLTILFLMSAALVPFWTRVTGAFPDSFSALTFYAISTIGTMLLLLVIWLYATRGYRLVDRDIDPRNISVVSRVILIAVSAYAVVVGASLFVPWVGYLGYGVLGYVIVATAYGYHRPLRKGRPTGSQDSRTR